jgi:ubiquinol-cytochrome c reductase cytochrome c1 subunit
LEKPGKLTPAEYDMAVADLVNYLVYMGEPARAVRTHMGLYVLIFLAFMFVLALLLKKEFWKDIH